MDSWCSPHFAQPRGQLWPHAELLPGPGQSWRRRGPGLGAPTHLAQPLLPFQELLLKGALQALGLQFLLLLLDELVPPAVLQDTLQLRLAVHAQAPGVAGGGVC